ncbi:hypothetical protein cpbgf_4004300 [Cryptosporidium parvum]|uniref:Uncharacterized protein n=1 Tax=Cryptosporidium parvum TaxID=5807 RepID=F0X539_CRYPV|nr:hypothetical protein CPATCC_0021570 [Cryptosporidium parvum]WKS77629.1 hypothetical protein CPCDC_4g4315 [Cryptosporidium sp. 43IA8]WRK31698.1 hypothetical protein cpbgf_4004300 [Cryptosporidium parvum]|eukprot:QOY42326.1 hypothetical protein CPATCC_001960 [Cryptosporidium parvum]
MSNQIRDFCDIAILKASYGINIGQTIFVRWIIGTEFCDHDNSKELLEKEEIVWWPGRILMTENEERDSKGRRVYMLKYEERDEFKSDNTRVVFESKERITHLNYNGISLRYCKNKDEIENIKESDEILDNVNEDTIEDSEDDKTITIQEILEGDIFGFSGSDESESGESGANGINGFANIFNSLPHEKKIHLAQGYREFADKFISFLRSRMSDDQNKNTITIDDVRDFMSSIGLDNNNNNFENANNTSNKEK